MLATRRLCSAFLWLALFLLVPPLSAQQGGQSGTGGGAKPGGTTGGGTTKSPGDTTTRTPPVLKQPQQDRGNNTARQRQHMPIISGAVVMEDGTPPPMGVVIERICYGNKIRESHVSSNGNFSFQIGVNTDMVMDASERNWETPGMPGASGVPGMQIPGESSEFARGSSTQLMGCELRADLAGYRSSTVILNGSQMMGNMMDVGTIVLHPISKVTGTTVSATNMRAPKDAKKAMERGDKALRKQKLDEAEKNLQTAVEIYPAYASAWFTLGRVYQEQQRTADARLAFSKAIEADGNFVSPYVELARIAAADKKWEEVASLTDRAMALDPLDFPDGFFLNSLANFNLRNLNAAERSARRAQRLDSLHKLPLGHLILASILQQKQDFTGEAEQLRFYLKYAPQATNAGQVRTRLLELEKVNGTIAGGQESRQ